MALHSAKVGLVTGVLTGAVFDIQPPAGEEWGISAIGGESSSYTELVLSADIILYDGTNEVIIRRHSNNASESNPIFNKPLRMMLTNSIRMRVRNITANTGVFYYGGRQLNVVSGPAGVGDVKSGITASVAAGSSITVQPPAGQEWALFEVGSSNWQLASGYWTPYLRVELTDGTNVTNAMKDLASEIARPFRFIFTNGLYLKIYNTDSVARHIGYCALRMA